MRISAEDIFYRTIDQMKKSGTNFVYPNEILWVVGPPASGKSLIGKYLHDTFEYNKIVEMREICNGVVSRNKGKFDMSEVIAYFVKLLFTVEPGTKVVIDDFVSISCAHLVPLILNFASHLQKRLPKLPRLKYRICVFTVEENVSITRQMQKTPNLTYSQCSELYQKFKKRSEQVINFLHTHFQFDVIDANLDLYKVKHIALQECKSIENGVPRTQQQTQKYYENLQKFKQPRRPIASPPGFYGSQISPPPGLSNMRYERYGSPSEFYPPARPYNEPPLPTPPPTAFRLQELSAKDKDQRPRTNESVHEKPLNSAARVYQPENVYGNSMNSFGTRYESYSQRPMRQSRSNTNLRDIMVSSLDSILQPENQKGILSLQQTVHEKFGVLLGQYLQEVTPRNITELLKGEDVEVRSQYYIQPATAFNAYIFVNQTRCVIFDSKWSAWNLPVKAYPKHESIIVYGKLFHVRPNGFVFLACDVVSDLTVGFDVDKRSRMMVKVATYLNSQELPIPVKVNLFIPPDENIILPTDKVRFDDHILPVSGLVFVSHAAKFLFDTTIPGYFWDFFDRLVTPGVVRKNIKLETGVPPIPVEVPQS